jgi:hypothetical protein
MPNRTCRGENNLVGLPSLGAGSGYVQFAEASHASQENLLTPNGLAISKPSGNRQLTVRDVRFLDLITSLPQCPAASQSLADPNMNLMQKVPAKSRGRQIDESSDCRLGEPTVALCQFRQVCFTEWA